MTECFTKALAVSESEAPQPPYEPHPIDTSHVRLPVDVERLIPQLAQNAHDVWALARRGEGWRYGRRRDDEQRLHPSLVDYAALPDAEREYDRLLVSEVLKLLISMGYRLEKR